MSRKTVFSRRFGPFPRMWGKRSTANHFSSSSRFIPTHVGETGRPQRPPRRSAVHPHACGGNQEIVRTGKASNGSSPRMWGKPQWHYRSCHQWRFIPTHVGKTAAWSSRLPSSTVHPHACGENQQNMVSIPENVRFIPTHVGKTSRTWSAYRKTCGSSPRMWGKLQYRSSRICCPSVHPHACGENVYRMMTPVRICGSSPRMWGKLTFTEDIQIGNRFIPTHVGETFNVLHFRIPPAVHPHACGGNIRPAECPDDSGRFIPTRMWGKLAWGSYSHVEGRFIPTHVGETPVCPAYPSVESVHPHACGGNPSPCRKNSPVRGSSPRMWGKLRLAKSASVP